MFDEARVRQLLGQQAAIANFGSFALRKCDLMEVLTEAARVCAEGLNVPFCKVCRYRGEENDLFIEAGYGWQTGVVGHVVSRADNSSPQGRAFITGEPSICNDLRKDSVFKLPPFYAAHGIISTVDVLIVGEEQPYGVLEIDNNEQHDYDQHDIDFLTSFANVLAEAVAISKRTSALQSSVGRMQLLVQEKDRLLEQKSLITEELHHRVRNNLQLVQGMVSRQLNDTIDPVGRRGMKAILRRISTLAEVYDHLRGAEMTRMSDFGAYLKTLCHHLADVQAASGGIVTLTCDSVELRLDLDVVIALGIAVTELVTNAYEHAFPDGKGSITASLRHSDTRSDTAILTVGDNGAGYDAKAENKMQGLGLVRRLIEQVRGTATVESIHGTVWTIAFPVLSAAPSGLSRRAP